MNEREQEVYNLIIKARDIALKGNDAGVVRWLDFVVGYMDRRSESERTG